MAQVGMVVHRGRSDAALLAKRAVAWLAEHGHEVRVPPDDAGAAGLEPWDQSEHGLSEQLVVALSLGGDGTMLRTVEMVSSAGVPVLGINVGHLGYLTECEPDALDSALARFFDGDYRIEERMTLEVTAAAYGPLLALNEMWLEKREPGRTVHLRLSVAGSPFITYAADGLVVATPTGSTAYNLSLRGPVVSPTLQAMIVKPVSPHQLFDLPLVLAPDEEVEVEVLEGQPATLLVDGRAVGVLDPGAAVVCRAGPHPARLVRFSERDFHAILKAKFGLADR